MVPPAGHRSPGRGPVEESGGPGRDVIWSGKLAHTKPARARTSSLTPSPRIQGSHPCSGGSRQSRKVPQFPPQAATAARAPSGHNTQPWRFKVSGYAIELYADPRRKLRVDPLGREMLI